MLPELMPAAAGHECPDHGPVLIYRQEEDWNVTIICPLTGCGYEVTS
jgi:hypothetical protein